MRQPDWTDRFNGTRRLPDRVRDRLRKAARMVQFPKGAQVFGRENVPESLLFLYDGRLRVSWGSGAGREIVLYRVEAGDSCVLTTACMLAEEAYNAQGSQKRTSRPLVCRRPSSIGWRPKKTRSAALSSRPIRAG